METHQVSDDPPVPPAGAYPSWILLEAYDDQRPISDARTVAHACTSKGRPISLSLVLVAPPAVSGLSLHAHRLPEGVNIHPLVIAAHGDSVLVNIRTRSVDWRNNDDVFAYDYFIYCVGDATRPPLSLLPPLYHAYQEKGEPKETRSLRYRETALLRRGQDEVLVVELYSCRIKNQIMEAEVCILRSGGEWQWELKWLPVIHDEGKGEEVSFWWTDNVIPVGDRFLLWVDYFRDIIYCDTWHETLRYLSLPVRPVNKLCLDHCGLSYRCLCATNGGQAVKFLEVFPHRCRCPAATASAVSCYAFTINTWALRMENMTTWDKVSVINCDELWSIPGYHGIIPRIKPQYPTVSLDASSVLCFMVERTMHDMDVDGDRRKWLIELDTMRMKLRSFCYDDGEFEFYPPFFAFVVSQYFGASSHSPTVEFRK